MKKSQQLRSGYTTGTCAQGASKAAIQMLFSKKECDSVIVMLPKGQFLKLGVIECSFSYEGEELTSVTCGVKKDSGDDPDVTNGIIIYSTVSKNKTQQVTVEGGYGVGRVTKAGLEQRIGEAAINKVPRKMILEAIEEECEVWEYTDGIAVEITIPEGVEIAERTFNKRLGILGGLSILGTSGIVEPMSEQALIDTIEVEIKVKLAGGNGYLLAAPGNYGLDFLEEHYQISPEEVIKCSNFLGDTIDLSIKLGGRGLLLVGHIGKLVKLAGGMFNTHSKYGDNRMELLSCAAMRGGLSKNVALQILECLTTEEALSICSDAERVIVVNALLEQIHKHISYRSEKKISVGVLVFSNVFGYLGSTIQGEELLAHMRKEGR